MDHERKARRPGEGREDRLGLIDDDRGLNFDGTFDDFLGQAEREQEYIAARIHEHAIALGVEVLQRSVPGGFDREERFLSFGERGGVALGSALLESFGSALGVAGCESFITPAGDESLSFGFGVGERFVRPGDGDGLEMVRLASEVSEVE
jgi:hypothetical protein